MIDSRGRSLIGAGALILAVPLSFACALAQPPDAAPDPFRRQDPAPVPAESAEVPEETVPAEPARDDPRLTAGGALRLFMASRDYRTLRALRSVMTSSLQGRFDHDSAPFCGKRGIRIAAFEFGEADLKPIPVRPPKVAAAQPAPPAAPPPYAATVRSLWEEQGETVEMRTETLRLQQSQDGFWRVADLQKARTESLRFGEAIDGVTTLRMLLRAWRKEDPDAARSHLSSAFQARSENGPEAPQALFGRDPSGRRRAAYQIVEVRPAPGGIIARVRLYHAPADQPVRLEGETHALRLVKKGPRFLLESWN